MMNLPDLKQLAGRVARDNDKEAYERLFYHFYDNLSRFAASLLGHEAVADDIVSEVFVNVWRNRAHLEEIENLQTYLYVSVRNLCMRHLSRRKTILLSIDHIDGDFLLSPYQTPEEKVLSAELIAKIEAAIQQLPPQCKQVFTLIKVDGIKYKDAAQILNISLKTVEAQMAIAIKRIRLAVDTDFAHFRN